MGNTVDWHAVVPYVTELACDASDVDAAAGKGDRSSHDSCDWQTAEGDIHELERDTGVVDVPVTGDTGLSGVALGEYVARLTDDMRDDDPAIDFDWWQAGGSSG